MDYKNTLLLPTTNFAMRGNLAQNEPKRYKSWQDEKIYEKMKRLKSDAPLFTLHDGPPYANGHIHIGHALNKILKDIIVKQHFFAGNAIRFTPGWDCHGLPIEQQVEKKLGGKRKKELLEISKIRQMCRDHAQKFVNIQRDEFRELGILADWDKAYITMDYKFEADIFRTLCSVAHRGLLVERSKPVFWSWAERTALAEAEVEYKDKESDSIFVSFALKDDSSRSLIIWTTTPWTLPSNKAVALNPEESYILSSDGYIVAKERYESLKELGVISGEIVEQIDPKKLEGLQAINPLNGKTSQIILGEHVLMDSGSGCVHTAPGHGEDDYRIGLKYNLEMLMCVDDSGCFDEGIIKHNLLPNPEEFVGKLVLKCNDAILELLGDALLYHTKFTHSYPHCWRSHTPLIFRATPQWFISVDERAKGADRTLREDALSELEKVLFIPKSGHNRLKSMVENRPDWCISRQRDWGVPIAFFRVKKTGEVLLDEKVLNFTAMIFEMSGSDAWYSLDIAQLLYPGSGYNPDELEKVTDILDVWFDSGATWNAVLKSRNYNAGEYQADLYLEGSDQHRGWFQSSLFLSCAIEAKAPYKSVVTHGFTNDAHGEKMSKSKGNVIVPSKIIKQHGSEILRLWVAMSDYQNDQKISDAILKQISENYRKLRNTFRIMLANIDDLDTLVPYSELGVLDRWILSRAKDVFDRAYRYFQEYNFVHAMGLINNFIVNELSGMYIDMTKDSLYCNKIDSKSRRASQSAMAIMVKNLLLLIAPILTYTADEIVEQSPSIIRGDADSIFELEYESIEPIESDFDYEYMSRARESFGAVVDQLKKDKLIKSTLEISLYTDSKIATHISECEEWFVVSSLNVDGGEELGSFKIDDDTFHIKKSIAHRCPRCWRHKAQKEDGLCKRCAEVLDA